MKSPGASTARTILSVLAAFGLLTSCVQLGAQANAPCGAPGYRVIGSHWDPLLRTNWELTQDCAHPEWPTHILASRAAPELSNLQRPTLAKPEPAPTLKPLLIHAGDSVRLWQQDANVRIEMTGIAEQSAHEGDRVPVRVNRQTDDGNPGTQRFSGVVRAAGDVEMER